MRNKLALAFCSFLLSCAGPYNSFGPIHQYGITHPLSNSVRPLSDSTRPLPFSRFSKNVSTLRPKYGKTALLRFSPEQQNWHGPKNFRASIFDPYGVSKNFDLRIIYNGEDITNQLSAQWKLTISPDQKHLEIFFPTVVFNPITANDLRIIYRRSPLAVSYTGDFPKPRCPLNEEWEQKNHPDTLIHRWILHTADKLSKKANINPGLTAGLIAQESNFNPRAVSKAGALGLTQITPIAGRVISKDYLHWPANYARAEDLSYLELVYNVNSKILNSKNDWRLDVDKSIAGGVHYLDHLIEYWQNFNKELSLFVSSKELRERQYVINNHLEELVLASYHSGPSRIKKSLLVFGGNWVRDPEIIEARKYTGKVISYCQDYYQLKEEGSESAFNNKALKKPRTRARYISSK